MQEGLLLDHLFLPDLPLQIEKLVVEQVVVFCEKRVDLGKLAHLGIFTACADAGRGQLRREAGRGVAGGRNCWGSGKLGGRRRDTNIWRFALPILLGEVGNFLLNTVGAHLFHYPLDCHYCWLQSQF